MISQYAFGLHRQATVRFYDSQLRLELVPASSDSDSDSTEATGIRLQSRRVEWPPAQASSAHMFGNGLYNTADRRKYNGTVVATLELPVFADVAAATAAINAIAFEEADRWRSARHVVLGAMQQWQRDVKAALGE